MRAGQMTACPQLWPSRRSRKLSIRQGRQIQLHLSLCYPTSGLALKTKFKVISKFSMFYQLMIENYLPAAVATSSLSPSRDIIQLQSPKLVASWANVQNLNRSGQTCSMRNIRCRVIRFWGQFSDGQCLAADDRNVHPRVGRSKRGYHRKSSFQLCPRESS